MCMYASRVWHCRVCPPDTLSRSCVFSHRQSGRVDILSMAHCGTLYQQQSQTILCYVHPGPRGCCLVDTEVLRTPASVVPAAGGGGGGLISVGSEPTSIRLSLTESHTAWERFMHEGLAGPSQLSSTGHCWLSAGLPSTDVPRQPRWLKTGTGSDGRFRNVPILMPPINSGFDIQRPREATAERCGDKDPQATSLA